MRCVRAAGWELVNVDSTVMAQSPQLAPHRMAIQTSVAQALGVGLDQVNVKAKTAEKPGPVGMGQSMEARAVALLTRKTGVL
jgi:2-C-methyl-D-erythritol 2,4-cyclodiphosphate synthase